MFIVTGDGGWSKKFMEKKKASIKYFWQVTYAHTISCFIAGMIAVAFFNYRE